MEPASWPPPPPEPAPVRPQLRRSRTDKILGGVNGGLAEYTGIDALLWRVGFVALTLAAGTGVLVYLLLWVLMPAGPSGPAAAQQAPKAPPLPRSPVPRITIAALLIVLGVLALLNGVADVDLGPRAFLGSALLVVGAGLVVAGLTGGRTARGGLIALGIVLSLALAASSTNWGESSGIGDRSYRPATAADVRDEYHLGVGDTTIDLSRIDRPISGGPVRTSIHHGVGDLDVIVPRGADVRLEVHQGLGDVEVFDGEWEDEGFYPGEGNRSWTDDGEPEFVLTINSGVGDVEVSRG